MLGRVTVGIRVASFHTSTAWLIADEVLKIDPKPLSIIGERVALKDPFKVVADGLSMCFRLQHSSGNEDNSDGIRRFFLEGGAA